VAVILGEAIFSREGFLNDRAIHPWVVEEGTGEGKEEKVQEPFCLQMQVEEPDFRPPCSFPLKP
jgi:hypothetical protein